MFNYLMSMSRACDFILYTKSHSKVFFESDFISALLLTFSMFSLIKILKLFNLFA